MTETYHARSRRCSLGGLILQIVATIAAYTLAVYLSSPPFGVLCTLLAIGVPLWFVTMLTFRQRELADLEKLDLEELRRERASAGGTEMIFKEGEAGFLVAAARLQWMQNVLVPAFSLVIGFGLIAGGVWQWFLIADVDRLVPNTRAQAQLGLILAAVMLVCLFFYARYTLGMARVAHWQLLRGAGSYMMGCTFAVIAVMIALGLTAGVDPDENSGTVPLVIAQALAALAVVLGVEILLNFVLDFYRPRTEADERRAAFDSRLLGLISEPGGIAANVADAVNYQFGFQVSQTWFYQLLQRTALPLAFFGAFILWLMTTVVVAQPYEHVIVERFGRQVNADDPHGPGLNFKLPWPIEKARKYNTGQLHEFYIGFDEGYTPADDDSAKNVELWSDQQHGGRDHFDFVISPTPYTTVGRGADRDAGEEDRESEHLARIRVVVQYRLDPARLSDYTQQIESPDALLRQMAWDEVSRFAASSHIDALLSADRERAGSVLRDRLAERVTENQLGLDIVFVGITSVHPHERVAATFRQVVTAQQDRLAKIREARVIENETLSGVAGDVDRARRLAHLLKQIDLAEPLRNDLERTLADARSRVSAAQSELLDGLIPPLIKLRGLELELEDARRELTALEQDVELGLGSDLERLRLTRERVAELEREVQTASDAFERAAEAVRTALEASFAAEVARDLTTLRTTAASIQFWSDELEQLLEGVEGQAAVLLANALAKRWQREMRAAGELVALENERFAYRAAPEIYKRRLELQAMVRGITDARKFVLAFDPQDATFHLRLDMEDAVRPSLATQSLTPEQDR